MTETFDDKVARVLAEEIEIVPYDSAWPRMFQEERERLLTLLPHELVRRIEHFGSTAVPGLAAKPVVDMLVEVTDLDDTRARIAPIPEGLGYDYFWRENHGQTAQFYAWFIGRDALTKRRTCHIHMVENDFPNWEALLFRDFLIQHPEVAQEYAALKQRLAVQFRHDREAYTEGKGEFVTRITEQARREQESAGLNYKSQDVTSESVR